jgi:hypothetical protein
MRILPKLPNMLFAAAGCAALALSNASADQNHGRGGHGGGGADDEHLFDIEMSMTPTADAPAGASARLSFEAENEDGTTAAELKIETRNLPAATYTVNATLKSDGSAIVLGTFTATNEGEGEIEFGHEGTAFPANLNPLDIASVTITGINGVVLFAVDLTNVTNATTMNISTTVQATAGPAVPNATGSVSVNGFVSRGRVKGSLQFSGHGLPANQVVVLTVNGVAVKTLHTSKTGDFNVKIGPKGKTGTILPGVTLAGITSVAVVDRNGNILLQASL